MSKIKHDLGIAGAHIPEDLKQHLVDIVDSLNSLKAQIDDLQAKYEAHRKDTAAHAAADETNISNLKSVISIEK